MVVPAGDDQSYLAREQRLGLKVVFVDRVPQLLRADAVVGDNRGGAYRAVTHLARHGHERIAFLGDRDYIGTLKERRQGYYDAMRDANLTVDPSLVITNLHAADTIAGAVTTLMSGDPPTALFTAQNFITIQSIRTLKHLELDDCVALVGFDDFDTADLLRPAVTVVSQSPKDMGSLAAQLLLNRIDGDTTAFETHVIPVNLIERGSGELEPRADLVRARLRSTSN